MIFPKMMGVIKLNTIYNSVRNSKITRVTTKKQLIINLYAGCMMEVMSEFYGEDELVPYGPKSISNLWSEFRNENKESMK
jgi:hypothetical protein